MKNKRGEKQSSLKKKHKNNFFPKNSRGQELSTNAMILIILGIIVLVVLILGFTLGWSKIAPWISSNNVDTIVNACGVACSTNSQYDYCSVKRDLKDERGQKFTESCNTFATNAVYSSYGVKACTALSCPAPEETPSP